MARYPLPLAIAGVVAGVPEGQGEAEEEEGGERGHAWCQTLFLPGVRRRFPICRCNSWYNTAALQQRGGATWNTWAQ